MANRAILPRPADVIWAGKQGLLAARPRAFPYANLENAGVYERLFKGWEAQASLVMSRLATEVISARLDLAEDDALRELAGSDYRAQTVFPATKAIGSVELVRTQLAGGRVPKGTRFALKADPGHSPPVKSATFVSTAEVPVQSGITKFTVPIEATGTGPEFNVPIFDDYPKLELIDAIAFDKTIATTANTFAAGGSAGISDPALRNLARATFNGDRAPTDTALVLAAILAGARHVAVFADPFRGSALLALADETWAFSPEWASSVRQLAIDTYLGFGCRMDVEVVRNTYVTVSPTVMLRNGADAADTSEIDEALRTALLSYFDDRDDWYRWTPEGLRAVCASAHPKILTCPDVAVRDSAGDIVPQPFNSDQRLVDGLPLDIRHFYFTDQGLKPTYIAPT